MVKTFAGNYKGRDKKISIVVSRFNEFITSKLLEGCLDELLRCNVKKKDIKVYWVPGAYEIPSTALKIAKKKGVDAVICLGAVIRGETYHFELVAQGASEGIAQVALTTGKPIIFGVLTTDTIEQAYKRSQEKGDNKGRDSALSAIEMVDLFTNI